MHEETRESPWFIKDGPLQAEVNFEPLGARVWDSLHFSVLEVAKNTYSKNEKMRTRKNFKRKPGSSAALTVSVFFIIQFINKCHQDAYLRHCLSKGDPQINSRVQRFLLNGFFTDIIFCVVEACFHR